MRYLLRISTALKGLVPCQPLAPNACKQSVSVASSQPPLETADVVKPAVKNSKRSEPVPKKAAALYDYSDEEPDQKDDNLGVDVKSTETELQPFFDCNRAGDVLRYWEQQKAVFPRLYAITRSVFCVPATTAGVERLFSIVGFLFGCRRLRLSDANLEKQILAHCNLDIPAKQMKKGKS